MADNSLAEFQRNQSERISKEIIGQSEMQERQQQANWQKQWQAAHQHLVVLFRLLDKDYDEACEKSNHPLEKLSDEDLAYLINTRIRTMQEIIKRKELPDAAERVRQEISELTQKYALLEDENAVLEEHNQTLQDENESLTSHLSALRQAQKDTLENDKPVNNANVTKTVGIGSEVSTPSWLTTWQASKGYGRSSLAILVMGDTGLALRPSIKKEIAKRLSLSTDNHSLDEAINRIMAKNEQLPFALVEKIDAIQEKGSSAGGNIPDILRLTADGEYTYNLISGRVAKKNEFDFLIRHHSSPEHTILNIQAVEFLIEAGYCVHTQVQKIQLSDGGTYIPDITVVDTNTGEILFIEVERDAYKDKFARKKKWMKQYEASNGKLYVFCDNLSCQRAIQGEINLALGEMKFDSFLTNLHSLRNGKRSIKNGSIWLSERWAK
ncbi:MAG: hypothetical protein JEZ00_11520 [Anaerolineaceae bacterium]|nr:hypothetical protein [Anaerolineaceae bacterium]